MGSRLRHRGAGFWEFLIVVSFLAAGVIVAKFYFASKKPAAAPTPVIAQRDASGDRLLFHLHQRRLRR